MKSWDLFDTLIGRACGTPAELFRLVGKLIDDPEFPFKRVMAERALQETGKEYDLEQIYTSYSVKYGITYEAAQQIANIEWATELQNVFPIRKYSDQVQDGDIIVSDMYLNALQLKELMHQAGIKQKVNIYVSCYGKYRENVWLKIPNFKEITLHTGDSSYNDVEKPKRLGIKTNQAVTIFSEPEQFYAKYSPELAYWLRMQRLSNNLQPDGPTKLHYIQLEYNLPFLWASSHSLYDYFLREHLIKLLFMSRDGQMFIEVFKKLHPEVPCEYIYISRDCLQSASESFFSYLNNRLRPSSALVDISASGGSLRAAIPNLSVPNPNLWTAFFLKEPFKVDLGAIQMARICINTETRCNNSHLERLNYADHWHVADVDKKGKPIFDQPGEYSMELVKKYHEFVYKAIETIPTVKSDNLFEIVDYTLKAISSEGAFLKGIFPNHGLMELARRANVAAKNGHVAIVGATWGYRWDRIATWYKSIRANGFQDDVYMIDLGTDIETVAEMKKAGIIVQTFPTTDRANIVERFSVLSKLLEGIDPETWVIFSDSDDLVFQRNPVDYLKTIPLYHNIVVASEGVLFKHNSWTRDNLLHSFPEMYEELSEKYFYNAGSIAAKMKILVPLTHDLVTLCDTSERGQKHDQAALNILLNSPTYKSQVHFTGPEDGWCYCGASTIFANTRDSRNYRGPLPRIVSGLCKTSKGLIPIMFHHYTRNRNIKSQVLTRYGH
jgi:hypothetical protein